ncbi:hypothetical protein DCC62_18510 [candidate division KSB1 bacterium]|nr:MAG: hypothetical protein DCC62_18510 [candidate division KSB1 bacterium]
MNIISRAQIIPVKWEIDLPLCNDGKIKFPQTGLFVSIEQLSLKALPIYKRGGDVIHANMLVSPNRSVRGAVYSDTGGRFRL